MSPARAFTHASEMTNRPAEPADEATDGRWIVENARRTGLPFRAGDLDLVPWSLVLRHAVDDHLESVETDSLTTTTYTRGQTVYGRIVVDRAGPRFRRARSTPGGTTPALTLDDAGLVRELAAWIDAVPGRFVLFTAGATPGTVALDLKGPKIGGVAGGASVQGRSIPAAIREAFRTLDARCDHLEGGRHHDG